MNNFRDCIINFEKQLPLPLNINLLENLTDEKIEELIKQMNIYWLESIEKESQA